MRAFHNVLPFVSNSQVVDAFKQFANARLVLKDQTTLPAVCLAATKAHNAGRAGATDVVVGVC